MTTAAKRDSDALLNARKTPPGASPRPAADEELWHHLQWFADATAALLEDDRTPVWLCNLLIELSANVENMVTDANSQRREAVFFRQMFTSLCEMAGEAEGQEGGAN